MSGTSLDGLDIAYAEFSLSKPKTWTYQLMAAETIPYSNDWKTQLSHIYKASAEDYFKLNAQYGSFIAEQIRLFIQKNQLQPDFIASHGHTVFHQPKLGFSTQIGCGATIATRTHLPTICDFRSVDVANGGQGAPLVPIGDALLFAEYDSCLNIGGIANISFQNQQKREAFDICMANLAFNFLSQKLGKPYDHAGEMAAKGRIHQDLLHQLNEWQLSLKHISLGRELFEQEFLAILNSYPLSVHDLLATCSEHSAIQIARVLNHHQLNNVFVTGGGAYNAHLIERMRLYYTGEIIIPEDQVVQFKEALIFSFLGLLRIEGIPNSLKSVTGAHSDSIGGAIYSPFRK